MSGKDSGKKHRGQTDWERIDTLTDREIEIAVASDPDSELLDEAFWARTRVVEPQQKKAISLRVDQDILEWFKKTGKGYQTRMNAVLRAYVETKKH